ncbi:hypothetical protein [Paraburkholderia elongata]|uniref:Uncharacterized protein n=1 Tax=Paraburkholderia elongata TaxID=2675747 RepID=A0A972NVE0_9BURK|nr:hypothetical protein [Paraburkholderia elongata]NPT59089.1 hypothetical protein [Paraburkholderia elongata]
MNLQIGPTTPWVAQAGPQGITATPLGFQQITTLSTAQSLTVPAGALLAVIQASTQAISWRDDGIAPTATVGMSIATGNELQYNGNLSAIQLIQVTSGAIANISYYR